MKNFILLVSAFFVAAATCLSAGERNHGELNAEFRTRGYKGNAAYTNHYIIWQGVETSHGYMFNEHHYIGAGIGVFMAPVDEIPTFGRIYADYTAYFRKRNSTPVAGIKTGFCRALNYDRDDHGRFKFRNAAEIEPTIGWSWTMKSGKGLLLNVAYPFYFTSSQNTKFTLWALPKLSFGIEF